MDPDSASLLILINFGYPQLLSLLIVLGLLACSAMISGSEVALFSLKPSDFPEEDYTPKQRILIDLLDKPQRLLATILVSNTFVNIAIVLISDALLDDVFGNHEVRIFGVNVDFLIKVVIVTFFLLLFGEILPKIYATRKNVQFADFMAAPLNVLDKLLVFLTAPMTSITRRIERNLGKHNPGLSVDQLSRALDLTDEQETTQEEQEILQSIVSFGNTETKQVMQPRTDIFALPINQDYQQIIPLITENGYSRIPVYEGGLDNVKGILYAKDLLPYLDLEEFEWQDLIREPYFVPENKKLDDLLTEFKEKKNHLAIVVDEYGGTSGLISMEDIIEEIVGEISDEFDEEDLVFSKLDENTYVLEGKTSLIDFYRIVDIEDPTVFDENRGDSETIAGFILEINGGFPRTNQEIQFDNYLFKVEAIDEKRIKQVKFSKL